MLIDMNILRSERIDIFHSRRQIVIFSCEDFVANLIIIFKDQRIERNVRTLKQIQMLSHISMTISVKIREKDLSKNRDYLFESKTFTVLSLNDDFLAHVISVNMMIVQIRNIFNEIFIVSKHFRVETLIDYAEEKCYVVFSENAHLAVKFNFKSDWWFKTKKFLAIECAFVVTTAATFMSFFASRASMSIDLHISMKTVTQNEIIIYDDLSIYSRLFTVIESYLSIWNDIEEIVNMLEFEWMLINTLTEVKSNLAKMYSLKSIDRQVINEEFDQLHKQEKMKWTTKVTSFVYSVFVIWQTLSNETRKDKVVVNIKELNKISKFDVYSMSLQTDILSFVSDCVFISVMNCADFFHQWLMRRNHRHKLTVVSHREFER